MLLDERCRSFRNRLSALPNNLKQAVADIDSFSLYSVGESNERELFSSGNMFLE